MKKHSVIILASAVALAGASVAARQAAPKAAAPSAAGAGTVRAHADIKGEGITGTADFVETQQGNGRIVNITVTVSGLKPGNHGFHLHAVGKCAPDFAAAGGHFDPGPAGNGDPDANHPFHSGDVPQLTAAANGKATMKVATTRVTLSEGPVSLFDPDGSAVIVHGNPDQGITGESKSGVSGGPRIACGVIEKK
jgi:superoxide dismutase, Cu-Zn family